jgi:gluconolactonase
VISTDAHEGPVYAADEDALYFTSLPRRTDVPVPGRPVVAIRRLALDGDRFPLDSRRVTTVRRDAAAANGMALDRDGRLVVCEQGSRSRRARIAHAVPPETIVDSWRGLPLNSPNDVVVKSDGTIWFTDPSYGHVQGFRPKPALGDHVYRHDPVSGSTTAVAVGFDKPNGLCFSPGERVLYVSDNGAPQELLAFDVLHDEHLATRRTVFSSPSPGHPDGLKADSAGRIYASFAGGIQVISPRGRLLGEIRLPGAVNFCFGGAARNTLFITTDDAIWAASLAASGA